VKSLTLLWQVVLTECGDLCSVSTTSDAKTALRRSKDEGFSFYTITLPDYGKEFELALDRGGVLPSSFNAFRRRKGLPVFLQGFLELVFDRETGLLLEEPSVDAIFAVRQITRLFSKIEMQCTDNRTRKAINAYLEIEQDLAAVDEAVIGADLARFHRLGSLLYSRVLLSVDDSIRQRRVVPKHGPGKTADRLSGNAKFGQQVWTSRLEEVFPMVDYLFPSETFWNRMDMVKFLDPEQELPTRLTPVPKTLKAPRLIAIEPTCMQYVQGGIAVELVEAIESDKLVGHMIGFRDQNPNRAMAAEGSFTGELATLDLSEASDRVANRHVLLLTRDMPLVSRAIQACRSTKVDVPEHGIYSLLKFASMGSALTFPLEAMVFLTVIFCGIEKALGRPVTHADLRRLRGKVRVFGDDIIVPTEYAEIVAGELNTFGYKVNANKSFWNGSFRESCGKEYYEGRDVSIVKSRQVFPTQRQDVKEIVSYVSLRNQFYWLGMWQTARWLDERLRKLIKLPKIHSGSPLLGRETFWHIDAEGFCDEYQVPLVKGWMVRSELPVNRADDYAALLKWFLKRGREPFADRDHLERSGRPKHVDITLGWAVPY
jgi:hypothetical protein